MPISGQLGSDFLGAGSGFGSAFGDLPPKSISPLPAFNTFGASASSGQGIKPLAPPSTISSISNMLNAYGQKKWGGTQGGLTGPGSGSTPTSLGGDWAGVDQWNSAIGSASSRFGVPANLIKAVMKLESGGQNLGRNGAGAMGPMQVVDTFWAGDAARMGLNLANPADNIAMGAYILQSNYNQFKGWANANGVDPWKAALYAYYAGNPYDLNAHDNPSEGGSGMSTGAYGDQIWRQYQNLNTMGGGGLGAGLSSGGSGGGGMQTAFGQFAKVPDWGEFNAPSNNGLYNYGNQYGLDGLSHTGVDIPMPVGTAYRAPASGVVTCGGTGVGSGAGGGGCSAFNDEWGQGAGRVEVLLDNGAVLIFGHSSTSAMRPGQRFNAGDVLGTSGGMNSAHVHLEARVKDPSMPSGYRIVDPRTVLGGGVPGMGPIGGGTGAPATPGSVQGMFQKFQGYGTGATTGTTPQDLFYQRLQGRR